MTYATVRQAREAGAVGTNVQVDRACHLADRAVDTFTGQVFTPAVRTLVVDMVDGVARLPYRLAAGGLTSVVGSDGTTYPAGTYVATSSSVEGAVDAITLSPTGSILIAGREPWAVRSAPTQVTVTGTFGWDTVPPAVSSAAAIIAASLAAGLVAAEGGDTDGGGMTAATADPEGNVLPVVPPFTPDTPTDADTPADARRSTGVRLADALLMPYRRAVPAFQAV